MIFILAPPKIGTPDASSRNVKAIAGKPFKIRIPYKGSPKPDVEWKKVSEQ